MSRSEQISKLLKNLSTTTPDIEAAAVVDNDGLMIASVLPGDVEDDRVAAMSAALHAHHQRDQPPDRLTRCTIAPSNRGSRACWPT